VSPPSSKLPSLQVLDRNLRTVTELLAVELGCPSRDPPPWTEFQWRIARAVAAMQGVAPLLLKTSKWQGAPAWNHFLNEQRNHVLGRHLRIEKLLAEIDAKARRKGVRLLALKGAALHTLGIYAAGERPMADIDVLIRSGERPMAHDILKDSGFELTFANSRHELFEPRTRAPVSAAYGEHSDNALKVELHTSVRENLPVNEIDITQDLFPMDSRDGGICGYRSLSALMMHLLLHASGNMRANALRQVQLHDIARLAERFGPSDWDELSKARPSGQTLWWAAPPLVLTARYFPDSVPSALIDELNSQCTWFLQRYSKRQKLADVSWSNIRIYALPGIEWCSGVSELLQFVRQRALPNRELRENLKHAEIQNANSASVEWYGISQSARILRWIFFRPPRVQTLLVVRSALKSDGPPM
jgi:hypothetical protein